MMLRRLALTTLLLFGWLGCAYAAPLVAPCTEAGQSSSECDPVNSTNGLPTTSQTDPALPVGATLVVGNATGSTGAVVGTLAGTSGKTTYLCGLIVSAIGGTATIGPITIANLITSSMVIQMASTASGNFINQNFRPCIPASAVNTSITITTTADGTASAVDVNSWGYQK
jgi:hypothetical protein